MMDEESETGSGAKLEVDDGCVVEVVSQEVDESKPVKFLDEWCLRIRNGAVYVEGKLVGNSYGKLYGRQPYHTARIARRLQEKMLVGYSGGRYGLINQLVAGPGVNIRRLAVVQMYLH
jgi:hypothetical protein